MSRLESFGKSGFRSRGRSTRQLRPWLEQTMRAVTISIFTCFMVTGCSSYQPDQLQVGINKAKAECGGKALPTQMAIIRCQDDKESTAWLAYAPAYFRFFQAIKDKRDGLGVQYDTGQITAEQMKTQYYSYQNAIMAQMSQQVALDSAAERRSNDEFARSLGTALLTATAEQAAIRAATTPHTQTTNCQNFGSQLHCTTYSY